MFDLLLWNKLAVFGTIFYIRIQWIKFFVVSLDWICCSKYAQLLYYKNKFIYNSIKWIYYIYFCLFCEFLSNMQCRTVAFNESSVITAKKKKPLKKKIVILFGYLFDCEYKFN